MAAETTGAATDPTAEAAAKKERLETLVGVLDKKMTRQLKYYLDVCARCAICKDACHQQVTTGDVTYLPAYRAELIRRVYKKFFTKTGEVLPALYEGKDPDDELLLDELYRVTYACTGCRRCMYYCPFSIDTAWILSTAKAILMKAGKGNDLLCQLADAAIMKGENIDMFRDALMGVYADAEKELQARMGDPSATIPIGKEGADILYVALAGMHSVLPAAVIFNAAKENWTLSLIESSNYGYFLGDSEKARLIAKRFVDEAYRLGVKEIVITECGHAYRVMKLFYEAWAGEKLPFKITHIVDVMDRYLAEGRIAIKDVITTPVTYHDPCQIGRNGGVFDAPRNILGRIAADFRELTPNREKQWCCGGGGGLVAMPEFDEFRMKTGKIKADQLRATGATILACPCENCRLQIDGLNQEYSLGLRIEPMMELVCEAMGYPSPIAEVAEGQTGEA
jgi:Fe-S oxidoreductase